MFERLQHISHRKFWHRTHRYLFIHPLYLPPDTFGTLVQTHLWHRYLITYFWHPCYQHTFGTRIMDTLLAPISLTNFWHPYLMTHFWHPYLRALFWEDLDICLGLQKIEIRFMSGFETKAHGMPRGGKVF